VSCGHTGELATVEAPRGIFESQIKLPLDPTVKGARFVPLDLRGAVEYGTEADGSLRALLHGYRITEADGGGVRVSSSRLPIDPTVVVSLPERMGGGALFASGSTVFRSSYWLGDAEPVFMSSGPISNLYVGLDRVYVRTGTGSHTAMNPKTGERIDMGPWPKAPTIGGSQNKGYVAADAWRAAAIADFYGVLLTTDAGTTWKPVNVPIEPRELRVVDGKIFVGDNKRTWFEIRNDHTAAKAPAEPTPQRPAFTEATTERTPFGASPLEAAAIEGWPLGDGTAVVARDGQLGRVRLDGGVVVDVERHAFPMNPARCKAIALGNTKDTGDFGFVCAEPEGKTALYAFDATRGALAPVREWKRPRVVLAAGNGAIAVRGGCDADAPIDKTNTHRYCVMSPNGKSVTTAPWHDVEVKFQGEAGNEHVVVLADGRVAIVTPPSIEGTGARLTIVSGREAKTLPLTFPLVSTDVARILKVGAWLDGMEEIVPHTIAGWIEASGVMLGVRVSLDGQVEIGQYVRDAGTPMVSGRYGLGWTTGKRGYETTDGGITWTAIDIPEHDNARASMRGCGPVGCTGPGWLRIGWGVPKESATTSKPSTAPPSTYGSRRMTSLRCEALAPPRRHPWKNRRIRRASITTRRAFLRAVIRSATHSATATGKRRGRRSTLSPRRRCARTSAGFHKSHSSRSIRSTRRAASDHSRASTCGVRAPAISTRRTRTSSCAGSILSADGTTRRHRARCPRRKTCSIGGSRATARSTRSSRATTTITRCSSRARATEAASRQSPRSRRITRRSRSNAPTVSRSSSSTPRCTRSVIGTSRFLRL
jgi:hypothetical protein